MREPYPQQPENPPEGIIHNNFDSKIPNFVTWELVNEAYDVLCNNNTNKYKLSILC